jgi:hypothetical protein
MNNEIDRRDQKRQIIYWSIFGLLVVAFLVNHFVSKNEQPRITYLSPQNENVLVLGQTDAVSGDDTTKDASNLLSENFKISQITVNDNLDTTNTVDFEGSAVLKMDDIKSELYSVKEGDKETIKAIISCNTSKRSNVEVVYIKSGEKQGTTIKDNFYSLGHMLILTGLDPDSVYKYTISAVDSNENKVSSEQFVFYTGAPNVSLMAVLENATQKVFGWAMKK